MTGPYGFFRPLLFRIDPETAHRMTIKAMKAGLMPACGMVSDPALEQTLCGLRFPNPVGMAAGFDKNAEVMAPLLRLGFGFVEAGTVTPKPQPGNPKPRIFRDPGSESVINRMGFPGCGMEVFKAGLEKFLSHRPRPPGVVGINIGMNKDQTDPAEDYTALIRTLGPMADYLTVNISSPNTPGLRDLQEKETLADLLGTLMEEREKACDNPLPPLFLKLAPDLDERRQEEIAGVVMAAGIDGLILTNTTLERPDSLPARFVKEQGGLSGKPLCDPSTQMIRNFYRLTGGKLPIIGVGGVSTGRDAYDKIKAGASLVQLYSSMVFQGPGIANVINRDLLALLKAEGFSNIAEAVGKDRA